MPGYSKFAFMVESSDLRPDGPQRPDQQSRERIGRVISSGELLCGEKEVLIEHAGSVYRLRLTRSGKLILHK